MTRRIGFLLVGAALTVGATSAHAQSRGQPPLEALVVNFRDAEWGPPGAVTLELGEDTHALEPGDYVVIPGAMNHSWDVAQGAPVVILVRRGGPADFNFVDP